MSTVAHELRTPLTGLSGYLDLILEGHVDDEAVQHEFLERGRSIVGSMTALTADLLELSRLESGSLQLDIEPFSVADALHSVSAALLPIALDRDVPLVTTPPTRIRTATGDRRRVEQIVTNLAAKPSNSGRTASRRTTSRFEGPSRSSRSGTRGRHRRRVIAPDLHALLPDCRPRGGSRTGLGLDLTASRAGHGCATSMCEPARDRLDVPARPARSERSLDQR